MNRYTIYCTEEQTKKALELGAPIFTMAGMNININGQNWFNSKGISHLCPTAEQMIGWLEEQEVVIDIARCTNNKGWSFFINDKFYITDRNPRRETTLEAIDAALDYLSKN